MFLLNPLSKSFSSHFSVLVFSIIIFLPEQVLAEPCDKHDNAAKGGRQTHVGEVVLNCFLHAREASGGGWSFRHWEGVVEHRSFTDATAGEFLFKEGDELHGLLILFLVVNLLELLGLLL